MAEQYYGPAEVKEHAQHLMHSSKYPNVSEGDLLIAIMDNGLYQIAPNVTDEPNYDHFYGAYSQGYWLTINLYTISEERAEQLCKGPGRVNS